MDAVRLSRIAAQTVLVVSFVVALGVHCAWTYLGIFETGDAKAEPPPALFASGQSWGQLYRRLKRFPGEFEPFFNKRLAWGHLQTRRFARFKLNRFGVSATPRVWLGDDGWLFYNHEADGTYYPATDPRLPKRLAEWERSIPEWREWLEKRGIRFLVVVAPDKQSVYPELLPALVRKTRPDPSPTDRLLQAWRRLDPKLEVLDLREPVRQAKGEHPLYYKTDTHWNLYGARVGYQATAGRLGFSPLPDSAFRLTGTPTKDGDLVKQLGYWPYPDETFDDIQPARPAAREVPWVDESPAESRLDYLKCRAWVRDGAPQKCLLVHDSFGDFYFAKLLAEHYGQLVSVPSNQLDPTLIEREKPDVVVLELVERLFQGIGSRRPTDPPQRSLTR